MGLEWDNGKEPKRLEGWANPVRHFVLGTDDLFWVGKGVSLSVVEVVMGPENGDVGIVKRNRKDGGGVGIGVKRGTVDVVT